MTGIAAKFTGKCTICHQPYQVGDMIDRANPDDSGRAHVACINGGGRQNGSARTSPTSDRVASNGNDTLVLEAIRVGLVEAIQGSKEAADALDAMREGLEKALVAIDNATKQPAGTRR